MRNSEPTTKLEVIGPLALQSEKAYCDIVESKLNDDLLTKQHCDPNAKLNDDIEIIAIRNDEEHKAMLKLQKQMLEHAERQAIINANRVAQVHQIIRKLRKGFIETNLFLQNSGDKRQQAMKLVTEEKALHLQYKEDNKNLREGISSLTGFRNVLANTVKEFEPYERILEEAANEHEVWSSSKDVMDRCDAIMIAQDEILKLKAAKLQEIEQIRRNMVRLTIDAGIALLGLNTTLQELERDFMKARADCFYWENILVNIKNAIVEHEHATDRMFGEVDNLYRLLCKRRRIYAVINDRDVEKRWNFIKDEIYILKQVLKECTGKTKIFGVEKKKKKKITFKRSEVTTYAKKSK